MGDRAAQRGTASGSPAHAQRLATWFCRTAKGRVGVSEGTVMKASLGAACSLERGSQ